MKNIFPKFLINHIFLFTVTLLYLCFFWQSQQDSSDVIQMLADPELYQLYVQGCLNYLRLRYGYDL